MANNSFSPPTIVAFRRSVLAAMVSNWMQTVIILLKQYSAGSIMHLCQLQMAVQSLAVIRQADCTEVCGFGQTHNPKQHPKSMVV